jgi:hypothetical protein
MAPQCLRLRRNRRQNHAQHNASSHRANQQNCLTDSLSDLQRDRLPVVAGRSLLEHGGCGTSELKQHGVLPLDQLLRLVSRSAHVGGLVGLRQTFARRRQKIRLLYRRTAISSASAARQRRSRDVSL